MGYDLHKYERFHTFSKVPAGATSELAVAVNKAGHIVQANEVRADAIPYCGIQGSLEAIKTAYATYPNGTLALVRNTDNLYQKTGTDTWQQITIPQEGKFTAITANGQPVSEENPAVLRWHYKVTLSTLNPDNNGQDSNRFSAKYLGVAGVSDAIGQFVTPTDNIFNNAVSGGYDVQIFKNGGTMNKGESEANDQWMDSPYSGMILFMKQQATTDVHKMTCFEYCGRTVSEAMASIKTDAAGGIKGVTAGVGITVDSTTGEGLKPTITVDTTVIATKKSVDDLSTEVAKKVASVGKDEASHSALTVTGTATAPTVKLTVDGTVTAGNTGLVTGGTVAQHLTDTTATAIDASSTTGDAKLVTAGAVKTHVTTVAGTTLDSAKDYTDDEIKKVTDELAASGTIGKAIAQAQEDIEDVEGEVNTLKTKSLEQTSTGSSYVTVSTKGSIADGLQSIEVTDTGLTTKIATLEKADTDNLAEAKKYTTDTIATELGDAGSIGSKIKEAKDAADQAKSTANEKVASVTVTDTTGTITSGGTSTAPVFTVAAGTIEEGKLVTGTTVKSYVGGIQEALQGSIDAIDTSLKTGAIHQEIDGVRTIATQAKTTADTAVQTVTGDTYVTATKSDTVVTLQTQLTALDAALAAEGTTLATNIAEAKKAGTDAAADVETLKTTNITEQSVTGAGITVTLGGKVGTPSLTGSVTTASYTPATETAKGSWSDTSKVAVASDVARAINDVNDAHTADIAKVTAAIEALTTSGFERVVVTQLPTTDIKLNAIYLIKNTDSEAGEYIEYIYVGELGEGGTGSVDNFEQIGSTKTDLSEYAKTVTVNGGAKKVVDEDGNIDLGTVVTSVDITTDAEAAGAGLVASIDDDGTLKIHSVAATSTTLGSVTIYTAGLTETDYKAVATTDHNKAVSLGSVIGLATRLDGSIATLTADKADKSTTYTKSEVDGIADTKADKSTTYTKSEVDGLLTPKADTETVNAALATKADADKVVSSINGKAGATEIKAADYSGLKVETSEAGVISVEQQYVAIDTTSSTDSLVDITATGVTIGTKTYVVDANRITSLKTAYMTMAPTITVDLPMCTELVMVTELQEVACNESGVHVTLNTPKLTKGTIVLLSDTDLMYFVDSLPSTVVGAEQLTILTYMGNTFDADLVAELYAKWGQSKVTILSSVIKLSEPGRI